MLKLSLLLLQLKVMKRKRACAVLTLSCCSCYFVCCVTQDKAKLDKDYCKSCYGMVYKHARTMVAKVCVCVCCCGQFYCLLVPVFFLVWRGGGLPWALLMSPSLTRCNPCGVGSTGVAKGHQLCRVQPTRGCCEPPVAADQADQVQGVQVHR